MVSDPREDAALWFIAEKPVEAGEVLRMVFQCRMCGECCSTMGEIISIREQTGDIRFRVGYPATMGERDVMLDPARSRIFYQKPRNLHSMPVPESAGSGQGNLDRPPFPARPLPSLLLFPYPDP
jgi:hypothetical protein